MEKVNFCGFVDSNYDVSCRHDFVRHSGNAVPFFFSLPMEFLYTECYHSFVNINSVANQ